MQSGHEDKNKRNLEDALGAAQTVIHMLHEKMTEADCTKLIKKIEDAASLCPNEHKFEVNAGLSILYYFRARIHIDHAHTQQALHDVDKFLDHSKGNKYLVEQREEMLEELKGLYEAERAGLQTFIKTPPTGVHKPKPQRAAPSSDSEQTTSSPESQQKTPPPQRSQTPLSPHSFHKHKPQDSFAHTPHHLTQHGGRKK